MRRRGGRKFPTNLHGNSVRHIGLQGQHVAKVAVVGFGPYVPVSRCVDQLCRNPDFIPGTQNRAFHHRVYVKLPRNFRNGFLRALVLYG